MTSPPSPVIGALAGLAAFGLYSGYDMTIKALGDRMNPMQTLFCAGLFALPLLLGQLILSGQGARLWPVLPRWTLARVAVTLLNGTLGAYAFTVLPLAQCYAMFFLMPLLIAGLAVPFLGEPMDAPRGLAIVAGLAGVVVALQPGTTTLGWGHLAAGVAATLGAVNYIIIRKTSAVERPGVILLYPMAAQVAATGLAMPWLWRPISTPDLGLTLVMGLELVVGGLLIVAAYRRAAAIVVAPMQYSQIFWATALGWLVFHEAMGRQTALGIAIIVLAGLFLLSRSQGSRAPRPDPA